MPMEPAAARCPVRGIGDTAAMLSEGYAGLEFLRSAALAAACPGGPGYAALLDASSVAADARDSLSRAPSAAVPAAQAPAAGRVTASGLAAGAAALARKMSAARELAGPGDRQALEAAAAAAGRIAGLLGVS